MKKIILLILASTIFSSCAIFQPTEKEESSKTDEENAEEVYVFDDISETEDKSEEIKELEEEVDKTISSKTVSKEKVEETDVFGENVKGDEESEKKLTESFYVQLGAFSTLKNAEQYVKEIKSQLPFQPSIIYNSNNSLYTVRSTALNTKLEAEQLRKELWSKDSFKDSFIVTE